MLIDCRWDYKTILIQTCIVLKTNVTHENRSIEGRAYLHQCAPRKHMLSITLTMHLYICTTIRLLETSSTL